MGDEELRLLFPAWPSGGRENFPGKAKPPAPLPDIDRRVAGLECKNVDEKTARPPKRRSRTVFRGFETTG
jgi:hypothetical protein